ncbi:MAG: hypothetical protein V3U79_09960 [Dehalococcoidia bacterium]
MRAAKPAVGKGPVLLELADVENIPTSFIAYPISRLLGTCPEPSKGLQDPLMATSQ